MKALGLIVGVLLLVAASTALGLLWGRFAYASAPEPCAAAVERAAEAQAALQVCTTIPGCQVDYRDLIEVRALIVAAKNCKTNPATGTRLYARPWQKTWKV